ncbi:MAG: trypsin-like peptidase domain-containing protein, partial [Planctomycetales bacterium]|nr:trypsin-like peptidase domain-containing protein [Planctomycetales bacterium]
MSRPDSDSFHTNPLRRDRVGTQVATALAGAALLLTACGGGAISSVDDAKQATVRIVATGSFVDPSVGLQLNAAGSGSGFIIDPSGIVVTNNHVVTGAATLEAFVGGNSKGVPAKVLGVSECADLAVIDLEGEGYPYVQWYDGNIDVNLEVRAAGFPLGDPEYTMTRGIVSKASADG